MAFQPDLTHAVARAIVDRAIAKARELKQAGSFAVLDVGGNVICISRMGEATAASVWIARAKAYVSAIQRRPSLANATSWRESPALFAAFQSMARDEIFPGPGAMPINKGGRVVGALAVGGIGPWTEIPGINPSLLMADGKPANAEDLVVAHALQIPYSNQHPDIDRSVGQRVEERVDDFPHCLDTARRYADSVIEVAREHGHPVGTTIVDEVGQLMAVDRLDGGTTMAPDVSETKALTALAFLQPSKELLDGRMTPEIQTGLRALAHTKLHFVPGGVPIVRDGFVVGAIGISHGGGPMQEDALATEAISRVEGR